MSSAVAAGTAPSGFAARFSKAMAIYRRDQRIAVSYDLSFIMQWLQILVQVLGFYFIAKFVAPADPMKRFTWWLVSLAFARFQLTAVQAFSAAIRSDQMFGTLECMLVTPTGLPTVVLSTGLWGFTLTAFQVLFYVVMGALLGVDFSHTNVLTMLVFVLLTILCMSPLGVMAASTIMTFKQSAPTQFIAGGVANLLGGVLFPITLLPWWLQLVSWCLPITHSLGGVRAAVAGKALTDPAVAYDAIWMLVVTALLMPISLFVFRRAVNLARRDGTLGHY